MESTRIITFIRTVPIFHDVSEDQLSKLARSMEEREFDNGEIAIDPSRDGSELFIVVHGEFQGFLREEQLNFERELARFYPGDYFGVIALLTGERVSAFIRAAKPSGALVLKRETVDKLFDSSPAFGRALCRALASYVKQSIANIPTIPFSRLELFPRMRNHVNLLPHRISHYCECLVVDRDDDQVKVAMVNPGDARVRGFIAQILSQFRVEFVAISEEDFHRHASFLLLPPSHYVGGAAKIADLTAVDPSGRRIPIEATGEHDPLPGVLSAAIRDGASDVHLEPLERTGKIRFRIDGKMLPYEDNIDHGIMRQIISRLKVMAEMDITSARRPQEGRFMVEADQQRVEFRVSAMPVLGGEKVVMRLIAPDPYHGSLDNLIVSPTVAMFAREIFRNPSGLVLVTGPTGAGKTTTLYAALNQLHAEKPTSNIVTIEDPIEYNLEFATQIQVNRDIGLDFSDILRSVLRQDPDIILVGEIRDAKSAAIAVEAATTGHLVLSSLHTYSALETLIRLRNLEVKPYLLAGALQGVLSQKLVPRLCSGYTEQVASDDPVLGRLIRLGVLDDAWSQPMWRGKSTNHDGPPEGELGRIGMFEVLSVTGELRNLIDRAAPWAEIENCLVDESFFSFAQFSRLLLSEGLVSPERVESVFPKHPSTAM